MPERVGVQCALLVNWLALSRAIASSLPFLTKAARSLLCPSRDDDAWFLVRMLYALWRRHTGFQLTAASSLDGFPLRLPAGRVGYAIGDDTCVCVTDV